MLRKTIAAGIASLFVSAPSFSGVYGGAAIGPEVAGFKQVAHVQRPGDFNVIDKNHFAGAGGFGTIFAGFNWVVRQFYLAAEVNANLSSVEYKLVNDEYIHHNFSKTTFTVRDSEGVSILPGIIFPALNSTVFYGRVGYANGRIKLRESDPTIQSSNSRHGGFRWGLGLRHAFTDHLAFMMDFSQTTYGNIHSFVFEPFGNVTKGTRITPRTAQVAFGLIYRWDAPPPVAFTK